MLTQLIASIDHTYVDHTHVTTGFAAAGIGVLLVVLGLVRKVLVLVGLAVVVVVAGVIFGVISLHGTHCSPTSTKQVCVSVR
jgi:hypothetical protein